MSGWRWCLCVIVLTSLRLCVQAASPDVEPGSQSPDRFVLIKVRLLPKPGTADRLVGARITGSNEGPTNAFVEMAKVAQAPVRDGWLEVAVPPGKVHRFVKFESAKGAAVAVAEIEFYSPVGRLTGKSFGTSGAKDKSGNSFERALDGDPNTSFEAPTENSYVGIDLGQKAQAPRPHFTPSGGPHTQPQKVQIGAWPSGATIRYTTDGSTPTAENGHVYKEPIQVSANTSFAAVAFQKGLADSDVSVASYLIGQAATVAEVKSYHIGNSLTDTVNGFLEPIAGSAGKNLLFMRKTIPGCGITGNWKTPGKGFGSPDSWAVDYNVVFARKIDHLFLQPFPNPPGLKDDGEYGGNFIAEARKYNPDVQVWLYAQWPALDSWKNDAHCVGAGWMQPSWFPPNKKPASWDEAMANKMAYYLDLKKRWDAKPDKRPVRLCPGGPALLRIKHEIEAGKVPGMTDFQAGIFSDDIHLSRPGRYLVSLVHFACMYGENPEGKATFANSGLTREQAAVFQRIAWDTVTNEPLTGVPPIPTSRTP